MFKLVYEGANSSACLMSLAEQKYLPDDYCQGAFTYK